MSDKTGIEWTDATWNPVTGCTKVSQGCKHCYAERVFPRAYSKDRVLQHYHELSVPIERPRVFTDVRCQPERLDRPLHWRKPRRIFVNSMSDLFHADVPDEFIDQVFETMAHCPNHIFQILTKRPERMRDFLTHAHSQIPRRSQGYSARWSNVWLGVSVEDQGTADERIPLLLETPSAIRFLSCEPLIRAIDISAWLKDGAPSRSQVDGPCGMHYLRHGAPQLDWIIAGGESGPGARPAHPDWFRSLRDQCSAAGVPFFFKQWGQWAPSNAEKKPGEYAGGGVFLLPDGHLGCQGDWWYRDAAAMDKIRSKKDASRLLDGREHSEFPA
jgi:protein gp37